MSQRQIISTKLNLIRSLAAIAVLANHLRAVMFTDRGAELSTNAVEDVFYFLTSLGHEAVVVFFVLSGYLVGGSLLKSRRTPRLGKYFLDRIARLWIVLIPTLILTLLIDFVMYGNLGFKITTSMAIEFNLDPSFAENISNSFSTFMGNVAFLQTIYTPVFGTNAPLWSLAWEFWYYIIFPLAVIAFTVVLSPVKYWAIIRMLSAFLGLLLCLWLPRDILFGFLALLAGVAIYALRRKVSRFKSRYLVVSCAVFSGALIYSRSPGLQNQLNVPADVVTTISFSLFLFILMHSNTKKLGLPIVRRFSNWSANFSYSLYAIHFPIVLALGVALFAGRQIHPGFISFALFTIFLTLLMFIASGFWFLFESRTRSIRKGLDTFFKRISIFAS